MIQEPEQPERTDSSPPSERVPYVPPTVEDIDTTSGPVDTAAGTVPISNL